VVVRNRDKVEEILIHATDKGTIRRALDLARKRAKEKDCHTRLTSSPHCMKRR